MRTLLVATVLVLGLAGCSDDGPPASRAADAATPTSAADDASPTPPPNPTASAVRAGYRTVSNARFGFSCQVPAGFVTEGESDNGDGVVYTSIDAETQVSCYGSSNLPDDGGTASARNELARSIARYVEDGNTVTYQDLSGTTVTVSGTNATGDVFYERTAWGPARTNTLLWTYPAKDKAAYDAAVTHSARTFRAGDLDG